MIHKRKGVTLAEMCIVMAVIAIVSLSVVSFATMASGRGSASAAKLEAMEELELVETLIDRWFAQTKDAIAVSSDGGSLKVNNVSVVGMNNRTMYIEFPEQDIAHYYFEKIEKLSFASRENSENGDVLYFCTVTYAPREENDKQIYTFCINPRVGETATPEPTETTPEENTQQ